MDEKYFKSIASALHRAGVASPTLVIDKALLKHNIECLKTTLDKGFEYRVVTKSLPSIQLLRYVMEETASSAMMCFHLPFLMQLVAYDWQRPINILIGKPMPIAALERFYVWYKERTDLSHFEPEYQLQWLVDSEHRLVDYEAFARVHGIVLRINLEVDVGLHRGGFSNKASFRRSVSMIVNSPHLRMGGLMGYDAHVVKMPRILGGMSIAHKKRKMCYQRFVEDLRELLPQDYFSEKETLCLNAAGSPTYSLYHEGDECNELSVASALVKPSDFDVSTLQAHHPAAFIASPVLKTIKQPSIPGPKLVSSGLRLAGLLPQRACFIYGGNWLAKPCYPKGARLLSLFGRSSNQEMYALCPQSDLKEGDFVFFRPTQSEAVFLQFGEIAIYENDEICEWWSVFDNTRAPNVRGRA